MATATYTTKSPSNWIRYPGDNTASSSGSHIVGWEGARYRIEKYKFTTGNYPITAVSINFGSVSHFGGNTSFTIYYRITQDSDCEKSLAGADSPHTGTVSISNGKATASKTINLAKNTTYYIYVWSKKLSGEGPEYWGAKNWNSSAATITATETQTTKCSAPTKVTVSKTIVSPTGSFKISWSEAKGGTNNQIVSYDVYLKVTSTGTAPTINNYDKKIWVDVTDNSTSGSTTIKLSDLGISLTRGYKIVCGVVTRGWAGSSYYSGIRIGDPVRINDLPKQPTLNKSDQTIPSTSNGITVTATAGSDSYHNTALKVYYSTSKDGNKNQYTSSITINPDSGEKLTYYFWTYDGLEYSSPKSITITKNIAPTISINSTQITTYNALGGTGEIGSQLGYAYAIKPNITTNRTGTVKITAEMAVANSDNDTNSTTSYGDSYLLPNYSLTSTSGVNLDTYNIHTAVVNKFSETTRQNHNIKWRLKFILNDGIEDSKPIYYPAGGKFYAVAHAPSLMGPYNRFKNSNIKDTNEKEIWREVRMRFYDDTSTPIVSVIAKVDNTLLSATFNTSTSGNERYVDITLPDGIKGGSKVQITVLLTNSNNSITKKVSCTVTETAAPNMGPLTHGARIIRPFTDTGTYQISMAWPFGNYENIETALRKYNCGTDAIQFVHASDTSGSNLVIKELKKQDQVTWKKNNNGVNDTITATLDGSTAYGWGKELGYDTYAGQKTYYCQIRIINLFGKTYTSEPDNGGWLSRIFDFNETAKNLSISSQNLSISGIQWATSNTDSTKWKNFNTVSETSDGNAAQEGMYLKFNLSFDLFTEEAITIQLKRKINNEESILIHKTYPKGDLKYATNRTAKNNEVSLVYGPVGTISDATNRVWSFQIANTRGTTESDGVKMKVQRQTAPDINFTSCLVDQNYNISYSFEQIDSGGGSIVNYLCDYNDKNKLIFNNSLSNVSSSEIPSPDGTSSIKIYSGTVKASVSDWEVKSICIKSVSTVNGLIKLEKEYYSNYIIVYKVTPTIAYRKNQLGINTDNPDTDYIIDIRPINENKRIRLYNGISDVIELDLSKVYNNDNDSCPAIVIKKETNDGTSKKITEYTLFFD